MGTCGNPSAEGNSHTMPTTRSETAMTEAAKTLVEFKYNPKPKVEVKPVTGADIAKFLERKGYSSVNEAVMDYC